MCIGHNKDLFFRSWDNWPSEAIYYQKMTDQITPHKQLYFSIKHSAGDFTRPAQWNSQLGVGKHAQIVEVELQREYEGKGSYPNYVMNGVIDGFPEMATRIGLRDIVAKPQLKGLWTWTRGGGWWGPYIHGNEQWVDLHARVLAMWWNSQLHHIEKGAGGPLSASGSAEVDAVGMSEEEAFAAVCPGLLPGCTGSNGCCSAFRNFSLVAAEAVLFGQWGTVQPGFRGNWFMRDDRMGDVTSHLKEMSAAVRAAAVDEKVQALGLQLCNRALWKSKIMPHLTDPVLVDKIDASVEYGVKLYSIIVPAWRVMVQGALHQKSDPAFNRTELAGAILAYDASCVHNIHTYIHTYITYITYIIRSITSFAKPHGGNAAVAGCGADGRRIAPSAWLKPMRPRSTTRTTFAWARTVTAPSIHLRRSSTVGSVPLSMPFATPLGFIRWLLLAHPALARRVAPSQASIARRVAIARTTQAQTLGTLVPIT